MSVLGSDPEVPVSELLFELPIQEMLYELSGQVDGFAHPARKESRNVQQRTQARKLLRVRSQA